MLAFLLEKVYVSHTLHLHRTFLFEVDQESCNIDNVLISLRYSLLIKYSNHGGSSVFNL
jgi:hypothetical protein